MKIKKFKIKGHLKSKENKYLVSVKFGHSANNNICREKNTTCNLYLKACNFSCKCKSKAKSTHFTLKIH